METPDIPQYIKDKLAQFEAFMRESKTSAPTKTQRERDEAALLKIRHKSLFAGLGEPIPHTQAEGPYPFALYRRTTTKDAKGKFITDERGDTLVECVYATSDEDKATKLDQGWFVNPLGIPEGRK